MRIWDHVRSNSTQQQTSIITSWSIPLSFAKTKRNKRKKKRKPKNAKRFQAIPENRYSSAMTRSWEEEAAAAESDWDRMASSSLNRLSMSLNLVVATFAMRTNRRKGMIWLGFSTNSFLHGEESKKCGRFRSESYLRQFPESTATGSWGRGSFRSTSSPCFSLFLQPARERERCKPAERVSRSSLIMSSQVSWLVKQCRKSMVDVDYYDNHFSLVYCKFR